MPIANTELNENMGLLELRQPLLPMLNTLHVFAAASAAFKSRDALPLENLAPRHQLGVLQRYVKHPPGPGR